MKLETGDIVYHIMHKALYVITKVVNKPMPYEIQGLYENNKLSSHDDYVYKVDSKLLNILYDIEIPK